MLVAALTFVFVGLALAGERLDRPRLRYVAKPIASAGFLVTALVSGCMGHAYGQVVFVALVLCALGDVFLLGKAKAPFLAGLVSFLLGHVALVVAFMVLGVDWVTAGIALAVTAPITGLIARWLLPQVKPALARPVVAYIAVITLMVAASFGAQGTAWIPAAAVAFAASDVSVALDRFAGAGFLNRLWGLPLYYVATLTFALTSGITPP